MSFDVSIWFCLSAVGLSFAMGHYLGCCCGCLSRHASKRGGYAAEEQE